MNKTPITVLQELMTKYLEIPSYECIAQTGPQHLSVFEYRCVAHGVTAHGVARSKKEAKQEAARRALVALAERGLPVPPPYRNAPDATPVISDSTVALPGKDSDDAEGGGTTTRVDARNSVALLKELCEEYKLGAVTYDLVGDTGPPHLRMFTIRATLASHERIATATTKKVARQIAAEQLYTYLRENLANATKDFVENCGADLLNEPTNSKHCSKNETIKQSPSKRKSTDTANEDVQRKRCGINVKDEIIAKKCEEALNRALDKAMSRYSEIREEMPWRPDLGQRIADYHLGVFAHINAEKREAADQVAANESEDYPAVLQQTAEALGLTVELTTLPTERGALTVVTLSPCSPGLSLAGPDPKSAARNALRYLRRALRQRPDNPSFGEILGAPTGSW